MWVVLCFSILGHVFVLNFFFLLVLLRFGSWDSRGFVPLDQEGSSCTEAPWEKPQGQGLEVPPYSYREPSPPFGSLLQAHQEAPTHLEVVSASTLFWVLISFFWVVYFGCSSIMDSHDLTFVLVRFAASLPPPVHSWPRWRNWRVSFGGNVASAN